MLLSNVLLLVFIVKLERIIERKQDRVQLWSFINLTSDICDSWSKSREKIWYFFYTTKTTASPLDNGRESSNWTLKLYNFI